MLTTKYYIRNYSFGKILLIWVFLHIHFVFSLGSLLPFSQLGGAGGGSLYAQDVVVNVTPISPVLPPQAGLYMSDPGKYFSVKLMNNSDEQQLVHIGMHVDMISPDQDVVMATPANGHIPREPIVLMPHQAKVLNPVEMRNLFRHFTIDEIGMREDIYTSNANGVVGLLPEGQYELYMQAYKWDPSLTSPVQLNRPEDGHCLFTICYKAQPPRFLSPIAFGGADDDPLSMLSVAKLDVNNPVQMFTWTPPTLNCNTSLVQFNYDVKVVKLNGLSADEAIDKNATEYQATKLATTAFAIPQAYLTQWKKDTTSVFAIQVTAHSMMQNANTGSLNFSLLENDGKSNVLLFRFFDPNNKEESDSTKSGKGKGGVSDSDADTLSVGYTFEQPTLIKPAFPQKTGRKVFVGDSIVVDWRKAWFASGRGLRQDTIKFEYTVALYKGNSADSIKNIFLTKPIYSNKLDDKAKALSDTIKWDKLKGKVQAGDYLVLRVTAKNTNGKGVVTMKGDSLNYVDFAMVEHFNETFACGTNTTKIEDKTPIEKVPEKGTVLWINDWKLTLNDDVKQDKESKALSGTGWINWQAGHMNVRVAVKFDKLMVNSKNQVYEGMCQTYPKDKNADKDFTAEQAVDSLFSSWGLDNIWGDLGLPKDVGEKVGAYADGEIDNLAKKYDLGKYYTYFKKAENQWDKWKEGKTLDLYFPTELPDTIKKLLPEDFSLQIANIMYAPQGAVMNVIGEFVLPKSDIIDNDVLIFGAPRLCVQQGRLLPEDGVLALLSNFKITDPSSGWTMTFKAPIEPLEPIDGCFLKWENDEFSGLGVEIAMTIPNLKRVVNGKAQNTPPILDIQATIKDKWGDWIGRVSMDPFEAEDLPGWIFTPGKDIILDHSYEENYQGSSYHFPDISRMPSTYDPSKVNSYCKSNWNAWQGVYIDEISVQFPKWAVFGKGEEGLKIAGQKMFFDNSGITCDIAALNLLEAKTGKAGGWEFDLDMAKVMITQNNFDSCHVEGRFAIPLFGKKSEPDQNDQKTQASQGSQSSQKPNGTQGNQSSQKPNGTQGNQKSNPDQGKIRFTCDIRHLTDGVTTYYTYDKDGKRKEHKKKTYGEDARMAYIFKTQQIDSLDFSCFVADVDLIKDQTYFVVAAIDRDKDKTDTYVELNMAGQINIADSNSTINSIRNYAKKLPLNMDFRGIHFAKMRLANFSYADTAKVYKEIASISTDSLGYKKTSSEQDWESKHSGRWVAFKNKELKLTEKCFLDLGEWSLTSPKKKIGPFSVELKNFKPDFNATEQKLNLGIEGSVGFCDDKVTATLGLDISSKLTIPSDISNISGYDLGWGGIDFRTAELKADLGMMTLDGKLDVKDDDKNGKGYAGTISLEIKDLFKVDVKGGYFNHKTNNSETNNNPDLASLDDDAIAQQGDEDPRREYAWGYFTADLSMDVNTSPLRFDPLVITRLSGGFYYNCQPVYNKSQKTFGDPECHYGLLGVSFGMGISATAGEKSLNGNMDLNVIYDKQNHRLTTFAFKGNVKAVSGIIKADMMLLYQNDNIDRFLALDITAEAGFSNGGVGDKIAQLNKKLEAEKEQLDAFQAKLDDTVKQFQSNPIGTLESLNSDYEDTTSQDDKKKNEDKGTKDKDAQQRTKDSGGMAQASFSLALKVTWREQGINYNTPKWHLYLGEPTKDKRCKITLIDFKSSIVSVNIGADAYLCLGNELPGNGQLPPIPTEISEFLNGGSSSVNTNADLAKAEGSRSRAVRDMVGTVNGGVMVGASAWGFINVDLGLFYGYLKAIAGFDMSLVDYGNSAFCTNLHKQMGHDGWYAMGQFYAYLAAKFGLHIKLGRLIDKRIDIVDAGIGGVFECGMPSPTWIEGRARVKMALLGGLVKINKKFHFECGDRCVAFMGNALDDFNLFDSFTLGSDSLEAGWQPENAYTVSQAQGRAMFNTTASLNSQYRLVDPSTLNDIKDGVSADSLFNLQAARTYIFNLDETDNYVGKGTSNVKGIKGVRLFQFDRYTDFLACFKGFNNGLDYLRQMLPSFETSTRMASKELSSTKVQDETLNVFYEQVINAMKDNEVGVRVRDKQGMNYHLSDMRLQPGKLYMLALTGTAYEVQSGQQYWCEMVDTVTMKNYYQKWIQHKFFFFGTKEKEEVSDTITDFSPYVALAYPAPGIGRLTNDEWENTEAYIEDISHPSFALREDIRDTEFMRRGELQWTLRNRKRGDKTFLKTETRANVFRTQGNCINIEPAEPFQPQLGGDNEPMFYNLRLTYGRPYYSSVLAYADSRGWKRQLTLHLENTYQHNAILYNDTAVYALEAMNWLRDTKKLDTSTLPISRKEVVLADMWLKKCDRTSWQMILPSNNKNNLSGNTGFTDPLPYERPFIGVRPPESPTFSYPYIANYNVDPYTKSETGYLYEKMDDHRLLDPYAYFSYLSNWVFIGGRAIKKYNFDDIPTPHASESLIFSYNTADLTASSQIQGMRTNDAMKVLRNEMFGVWNDWRYNNNSQPQYPLPTRLGSDYDITFANQDGKATPYYTPWNKKDQSNQMQYGLKEYLQDFAAPYYVAEALCDTLKGIADELVAKWRIDCKGDNFDNRVKEWNNLHRGQYLTVECRGFQVKVPYYQMPLIFGDCCVNAYDPVAKESIDRSGRGFKKSLGESNIVKARWKTYVSNLFFWRLTGGYVWQDKDDFAKFYNYKVLNGKTRAYVNYDKFNAKGAMANISSLKAYVYRVNSYDINTGLYTVSNFGPYDESFDPDRTWWGPKTVAKPNKQEYPEWISDAGKPDVLINGKVYAGGTASSYSYANMDTTPDEKPIDNDGTSTTGSSETGSVNQFRTITSGEDLANELIYHMLLAKAKKSVADAATMLLSIKKQDEALYQQLYQRLIEEMPEIKNELITKLNINATFIDLLRGTSDSSPQNGQNPEPANTVRNSGNNGAATLGAEQVENQDLLNLKKR